MMMSNIKVSTIQEDLYERIQLGKILYKFISILSQLHITLGINCGAYA